MSERQQTLCVRLLNCVIFRGNTAPRLQLIVSIRSTRLFLGQLSKSSVSSEGGGASLLPDVLVFDVFVCATVLKAHWILLKGHGIIVQVLVHITLIW